MSKNYIKATIISFIVIILAIPFLVEVGVERVPYPKSNVDNGIWISFWGTYLGAIFSGVITIVTLVITISYYKNKETNDKKEDERKRQYELILKYRPYLVVEALKDEGKVYIDSLVRNGQYEVSSKKSLIKEIKRANVIERWVQCADEEISLEVVKNYGMLIKIKNIGNGPALKVQIEYKNQKYSVSGFNDMVIDTTELIGCKLPTTMSKFLEYNHEEIYYVLFKVSESAEKLLSRTYYNIMINIMFEDIYENKICLPLRIDLNLQAILGMEPQEYEEQEIKELVGIFNEIKQSNL